MQMRRDFLNNNDLSISVSEFIREFASSSILHILEKLGLDKRVGLSWSDESFSKLREGLRLLYHWKDLLLHLGGDGMFLSDADFREHVTWCQNIVLEFAFGRVWASRLVSEFWSSFSKRDKYGLELNSDSFLGFDFVDEYVRNSVFGIDNLIRACMVGFFTQDTSAGSVVAYNIWNSMLRRLICMRVFVSDIDWNALVNCVLNSDLYEILARHSFECRLSGEQNKVDSWFSEWMLRGLLAGSRLEDQVGVQRFCELVGKLVFVAAIAEWGNSTIVVDWVSLKGDRLWKVRELLHSFLEVWGLSYSYLLVTSQLRIAVHPDWFDVGVSDDKGNSSVRHRVEWLNVLEAIVRGKLDGFLRDYYDKIRSSADILQKIREIQHS
jgi:hypothetical protein